MLMQADAQTKMHRCAWIGRLSAVHCNHASSGATWFGHTGAAEAAEWAVCRTASVRRDETMQAAATHQRG
jgi:hypothetical protein